MLVARAEEVPYDRLSSLLRLLEAAIGKCWWWPSASYPVASRPVAPKWALGGQGGREGHLTTKAMWTSRKAAHAWCTAMPVAHLWQRRQSDGWSILLYTPMRLFLDWKRGSNVSDSVDPVTVMRSD